MANTLSQSAAVDAIFENLNGRNEAAIRSMFESKKSQLWNKCQREPAAGDAATSVGNLNYFAKGANQYKSSS